MRIKSSVIFLSILLISALYIDKVFALTAEEVRNQITNTNSEIAELDKQIAKYQKQIAETAEEKASLAKLISELTLTRNKLSTEKQKTEKKIIATDLVIEEISSTINDQEKSIRNSKEFLSKTLVDMYINDSHSFVEKILSKEKFADSSFEYNSILSLNENIQKYLKDIRIEKDELTLSKYQKLTEQEKLEDLKKDLTLRQEAVESTKREKDKVLVATKNKESEFQKILAEQIKRKESFEKAIEDYEAQLKFILNPNILPEKGSGVLSWPLNSILITSPFGARWGRFHYGTDFRAAVGTSVFAMSDGTVEGTGNTDIDCPNASFGNWIFIRYNNGLSSTFGHLSVISVKKGDIIKRGDIVGLSGGIKGAFGSGSSTGPHLHVGVYASTGVSVDTVPSKSCNGKIFTQPISALNAYLDPLFYLPKTTTSMFK